MCVEEAGSLSFLLETAYVLWVWKFVCYPEVRRERRQCWTCEKRGDGGGQHRETSIRPLQKEGM